MYTRHAFALIAAGSLAIVSFGRPAAMQSAYVFSPDVTVSGPSTLISCPFGASEAFASAYDGAEIDAVAAVDPTDTNVITSGSQQDFWPDGGARGLTTWTTNNGGVSWTKLPDGAFGSCQDGPQRFPRASDASVSYDKGGAKYLSGLLLDRTVPISAVGVSAWTGTKWDTPQILVEDSDGVTFNDNVMVTGDRTRAGHAYVTWIRGVGQAILNAAGSHSLDFAGQLMISRTTDGGSTWSPPLVMRKGLLFQGPDVAVLPDGALLTVAAQVSPGPGQGNRPVTLVALRSADAGLTWSGPFPIATFRVATLFNPDDQAPARGRDYQPHVAVDTVTGAVYAVWSDAQGGTINRVVMTRSTNGGRQWSTPVVVATGSATVQSFNHAVTVTEEGTLVVAYYDFRNNVLGDGVLSTDIWLRHSHTGGTTWEPEQHLHGPFDMNLAPLSNGDAVFLGDRQSVAPRSGDNVIIVFTSTMSDGADVHAVSAAHP